uniref:Uncharacterized protein n=1 Tax=Glossina brevipalpis TaxID=37001 RepID=A0A1A9WJE3_9MUSC
MLITRSLGRPKFSGRSAPFTALKSGVSQAVVLAAVEVAAIINFLALILAGERLIIGSSEDNSIIFGVKFFTAVPTDEADGRTCSKALDKGAITSPPRFSDAKFMGKICCCCWAWIKDE